MCSIACVDTIFVIYECCNLEIKKLEYVFYPVTITWRKYGIYRTQAHECCNLLDTCTLDARICWQQ